MREVTYDEMIPYYLKQMADSQILKAENLQTSDTLQFLLYTDSHITNTSSFADIYTLNYINSKLKPEFTACCGDNLDNAPTKDQHLETASKLMDTLTVNRFFTVKGNHDDNSIISEGTDNIKSTMLPQEQFDIMFKGLEGVVNFDSDNKSGLYYYYDMDKYKVRAIFLNSIDIPYMSDQDVPTAWKYSGQSTYAYSDTQLNWLTHKALRLPDKDWKVIFFTHVNPFEEGMIGSDSLARNGDVLLGIVDAFRGGSKYKSIPAIGDFHQDISVDFTEQGEGNIIAFFYGHTHSEQVLIRKGIRYISTWNDCPKKSASNPQAPARTVGTTSEICLNAVTVDLVQNRISFTKFGAGEDLVVE
ncbi:metallophosphoesterase [Anaerocolumna sp. AGMB13025]|uniref:metallophosphoesterase family protein n=1 Tax=Anaerocolumna sp. AGMB13025 TaxID=3039116 RepID=UPI00241DD7A5|nr:metallophosphoesterase [Anaerocolumna sp. AGMB13025]WFR55515.1 metallophosphoesterase [Anaerocolumna sp. AGMB13025]